MRVPRARGRRSQRVDVTPSGGSRAQCSAGRAQCPAGRAQSDAGNGRDYWRDTMAKCR